MKIRFYQPEDLASLNVWYAARGQPGITRAMLPTHGYFAPGLAAGFLYRTDSCFGFLDTFVTNPGAPQSERALALQDIACRLMADFRGGRLLIYTTSGGIRRWAQKHGFSVLGTHTMLSKEL